MQNVFFNSRHPAQAWPWSHFGSLGSIIISSDFCMNECTNILCDAVSLERHEMTNMRRLHDLRFKVLFWATCSNEGSSFLKLERSHVHDNIPLVCLYSLSWYSSKVSSKCQTARKTVLLSDENLTVTGPWLAVDVHIHKLRRAIEFFPKILASAVELNNERADRIFQQPLVGVWEPRVETETGLKRKVALKILDNRPDEDHLTTSRNGLKPWKKVSSSLSIREGRVLRQTSA